MIMSKYILPENDIIRTANWISNFLIREGYHIDYTLQSLKEIDKFFKEKINKILKIYKLTDWPADDLSPIEWRMHIDRDEKLTVEDEK